MAASDEVPPAAPPKILEPPVPALTRRVTGRRLTVGAAIQLVGRLLTLACGLLVTAVLARSLGPTDFGHFTTAFMFVGLFFELLDFGVSSVAVRQMAERPERRAELTGALFAIRGGGGLVLVVVGGLLTPLVLDDGSARVAALILLLQLPLTAFFAYQSVAQARLRPELVSVLLLVQRVTWLGLVLLLAAVDGSLAAVGAAYVLSIAAQASVQWVLCHRLTEVRLAGSGPAVRRLYADAWPFGLASMFVLAYYGLDIVLLYRIAGAAESAVYGAAYRFVDSLHLVPMTMLGILLPMLSATWHDVERRRQGERVFHLAQSVGVAIALPIAVGGALLSRELVDLVYGEPYVRSADLAPILFVAFVPITLGYVYTGLLLATDRIRAYCVVAAAAMVLNISANVLLIPRYGADASAWLTLLTEIGVNGTIATLVVRGSGTSVPVGRWARTAAAVAVMAGVVLVGRDALGLAVAVPAGAVYVAALVGLRGLDVPELLRAVRRGEIHA